MVSAMARQRRRLWLASAAIALSVGYLAGALTLLNRVSDGLTDLSAAGIERADLVIEGDVAYESALEQTRRLISTNIAVSLVGQPDVAAVVPRVEDIAVIIDPKGNSLVAPGLTEQPIGANWPGDPKMSPYEFVGRGRAPKAADEVVIDHRSAERAGIKVGDSVSVVARGGLESYRVVGVVTTSRGICPTGHRWRCSLRTRRVRSSPWRTPTHEWRSGSIRARTSRKCAAESNRGFLRAR